MRSSPRKMATKTRFVRSAQMRYIRLKRPIKSKKKPETIPISKKGNGERCWISLTKARVESGTGESLCRLVWIGRISSIGIK